MAHDEIHDDDAEDDGELLADQESSSNIRRGNLGDD